MLPFLVRLRAWKKSTSPQQLLCHNSAHWRPKFAECLESLGLTPLSFRPYSIRRGGATYWFGRLGSLDRVVVLGRWQAQRTAWIYINEGMAAIAERQVPHATLRPFLTIFKAGCNKPRFT